MVKPVERPSDATPSSHPAAGASDASGAAAARRLSAYRRGHSAEWLAAAALRVSGHKVLARRYKTAAGEIDLVTVKGRRVGFVEVKRRATRAECEAAITAKLRQRVRAASSLWLARHPTYQQHDVGFDLVFVTPWRWPAVLRDAL